MILYVNGENFSAGANAVNDFLFANDDFKYVALGTKPHPDNLLASYGMQLSKMLKLALVCKAESLYTNRDILETSYRYLDNIDPNQYTVVVIGWAKVQPKDTETHNKIFELHEYLTNRNIPHLFFNSIAKLDFAVDQQKDWGNNYIDPYTSAAVPDHLFWAQYLFSWLTNKIL